MFLPPLVIIRYIFICKKERYTNPTWLISSSDPRLSQHIFQTILTLCWSNLNPYCLGRKAAFFSALSNSLTFQLESP
jgi:hypothetical protein